MHNASLRYWLTTKESYFGIFFHMKGKTLEQPMSWLPLNKRSQVVILQLLVVLCCSIYPTQAQDLGPNLNTDCDVSADALSGIFGTDIPRTCIEFNGRTRCFYTYIPPCASGEVPLVYDIHPLAACPAIYSTYSGWFEQATSECFVVVWPIGLTDPEDAGEICFATPAGNVGLDPDDPTKATSSCCCVDFDDQNPFDPVDADEVGDVDFIRSIGSIVVEQLASDAATNVAIDPRRIYVSGHSNGCYLSFAMAMVHSDYVAAVACMAGLWVTPPASDYSPTPIWAVHGLRDVVAPFNGFDSDSVGFVPSVLTGYNSFAALNGCSSNSRIDVDVPEMSLPLSGPGTLTTLTSSNCTNNATVEFLVLSNAGHTPFRKATESFPIFPLATSTTVDTTALAWEFVSTKQLDDIPPEFIPAPTFSLTAPPTISLTAPPTFSLTSKPTSSPTRPPTLSPTLSPSIGPTAPPTLRPTSSPTARPTTSPTAPPTFRPTKRPTTSPTAPPTFSPTKRPTTSPTSPPTSPPTSLPEDAVVQEPFCGAFRSECSVNLDCCSSRCVLNQCQRPIPNLKVKLSTGRGGAAAEFKGVRRQRGLRR